MARAAAGNAGSAFVALAPSDVYASSYVGEAERVVRNAFKLARATTPCILFFDEIDSILGAAGDDANHGMNRSGGGSSAESRVLSTFLNEMDGVDGSWEDGVMILGATNRPWTLDKALLRSGRFDRVIYVPPPDDGARLSLLRIFCKNPNTTDEDLRDLVTISKSMTGAEIIGACRAAAIRTLREAIEKNVDKPVEVTVARVKESLLATQPLLSQPGYLNQFIDFDQSR